MKGLLVIMELNTVDMSDSEYQSKLGLLKLDIRNKLSPLALEIKHTQNNVHCE